MYRSILFKMRAKSILLYSFCIIFFSSVTMLQAGSIPQQINYQGKLLENNEPVTATKNFVFRFAGSSWSETHYNVQVTNGLYSVVLGSIQAIPESLFDDQSAVQLEISVDGSTLSPKTDVVSVGYAFKAAKAEDARKIDGNPVSGSPQKNQVLQWNGREWSPATISGGLKSVSAGSGLESSGSTEDVSIFIPTGGISQIHMADNSISSDKIQDGSIKPQDLSFVPSQITSIRTEQPLEGGGNSGLVNVSLKVGSISNAYLADNSVNSQKILDGSIQRQDLNFEPGEITDIITGEALTGGGSSGKVKIDVADKGISGKHLAANAVDSSKIKDASINKEDLSFETGDHLGNHVASKNVQMNRHWVSSDGDDEGVFVSDNGNVGIGTSTPEKSLDVQGDVNIEGKLIVNNSLNNVNTNGLSFLNGFMKGCGIEWFGIREIKVHKGIVEVGGTLYQIEKNLSIEIEKDEKEGLYSICIKKPDSQLTSLTKDDLNFTLNTDIQWDDEKFGWYLQDNGNELNRCIGFFYINANHEITPFYNRNGIFMYRNPFGIGAPNGRSEVSLNQVPKVAYSAIVTYRVDCNKEKSGGVSLITEGAGGGHSIVWSTGGNGYGDDSINTFTIPLNTNGKYIQNVDANGSGVYAWLNGFYWNPDQE